MEVHLRLKSGSVMSVSLKTGNAWAWLFEVLPDLFQGNFGGIGEQLVKVVWSSSILAMCFVPHVVCDDYGIETSDWTAHVDNGKKPFPEGAANCSTITRSVGGRLCLAEKLLLHSRYLASIRRADSQGVRSYIQLK